MTNSGNNNGRPPDDNETVKGVTIVVPMQENLPLLEQLESLRDQIQSFLNIAAEEASPEVLESSQRIRQGMENLLGDVVRAVRSVQHQKTALAKDQFEQKRNNLAERFRSFVMGVKDDLYNKRYVKLRSFVEGLAYTWQEQKISGESLPQKVAHTMDYSILMWILKKIQAESEQLPLEKLSPELLEQWQQLLASAGPLQDRMSNISIAQLQGSGGGGMNYCTLDIAGETLEMFPVGLFPGHQRTQNFGKMFDNVKGKVPGNGKPPRSRNQ